MDESFVSVPPVGADEVKTYKIHVSDSHHTASFGAKSIRAGDCEVGMKQDTNG